MRRFDFVKKREFNKRFCVTCNENKQVCHLRFMRQIVNVPTSSEHVLNLFYDFETTQDTERYDMSKEFVPNRVCFQNFSSKRGNISHVQQDCIQCGKHIHSFWGDAVGDILSNLCESRPWVEKIIVFAHNAKAFDFHFILKRAILLIWQVELILNGKKIMCMPLEYIVLMGSVSFLPFQLRKLPEAFGLTVTKSWYPH